jgi:intracellular multiplication protein IcmB
MNAGAMLFLALFVILVIYAAVVLPAAVGGGRYAWRLFEFIEGVSLSFDALFKRGAAVWFDPVTADMAEVDGVRCLFATAKGDLVTLIRVRGVTQVQDDQEVSERIESMLSTLSSYFSSPAHSIQIRFHFEPEGGQKAAAEMMEPNRRSAERLKLDMDFLLKDWAKNLGRFVAEQGTYIAITTNAGALPSKQQKRDAEKNRAQGLQSAILSSAGQNVMAANAALLSPHTAFLRSLMQAFSSAGILADVLDAHEGARVMRASVAPSVTPPEWRAHLPGDPMHLRQTVRSDQSSVMYPLLAEQVFPVAMRKDGDFLVVGDRRYAFVYLSLWPQSPKPFGVLMASLQRASTPYAISFLLSGGALDGTGINSALASLFAIGSTHNKILRKGLVEVQNRILEGETMVGAQAVLMTWTSVDAPLSDLRERQAAMVGAVSSWGACEPSTVIGDPALAFTAMIPGATSVSPAPKTPAPLSEIIPMLPIERVANIWRSGSVLYRAGSKLFPFEQGSSLQSAPVEVGFAPMGGGKSVNIGVMNLGFILQSDDIPYLSTSDIGPSSLGLVTMLQMGLPPSQRHLAQYHRLRWEPRFTTNVFDLPLGANKPLPMHEKFLVNFICLLCGDSSGKTDEAIPGLATVCIQAAYEDRLPQNQPRRYSKGLDMELDDAIHALGVGIHPYTTWYDIRDVFFDAGKIHEATLAQRYAVPTLSEIGSRAQSGIVSDSYKKTISGETITYFFYRKINEAIQRIPILDGASRFSLDDARVVALDLDEVAPNTGGEASGWLSAVAVMLSRHLLASRFFVMPEDAQLFEPRYIAWQAERITRLRESPKRIVYDELQRFSQNKAVVDQFVADAGTMVREGRKWNLHLAFYSQSISHIPDDIVSLSFTRYIFGGSKAEIDKASQKLHLSQSAKQACLRIGSPGKHGANFVAIYRVSGVKSDECVQFLTSTVGPSLLWSLETTPENAAVRNRLYERWGARKTIAILGRHYSGGVKDQVKALAKTMPSGGGDAGEGGAAATMAEKIFERFDAAEIQE